MKLFISLLLMLNLSIVNAADEKVVDRQKQIKDIQSKVEELLKGKQLTPEKKFFIYVLGAKKLRTYQEWSLSQEYYIKALSLNVDIKESKFKTMTELGFVYFHQKKYDELVLLSNEMEQLAQKNKLYEKDKSLEKSQLFLSYLGARKLLKDSILKDVDYFKDSPFFNYVLNEEVKLLMKQSLFLDAYNLISRTDFVKDDHNLLATFDLLRILNNKQDQKRLCQDELSSFASNPALPLRICRLVTAAANKKLTKEEVAKIVGHIEKESTGYFFMIPALKKLADTFGV